MPPFWSIFGLFLADFWVFEGQIFGLFLAQFLRALFERFENIEIFLAHFLVHFWARFGDSLARNRRDFRIFFFNLHILAPDLLYSP